ncbi:alpha/beta hydrolase [Caulobacter sp. UC70_42]|uniref:alpha/beta hydrolase n=1 Tax=Caulobacter sp. UC70_42 TaxID=3374551 RepID=UPI003757216D
MKREGWNEEVEHQSRASPGLDQGGLRGGARAFGRARGGGPGGHQGAPVVAGAKPVTLQRIKVHSSAIEGNLEGETADRDVLVFLPPGYASHPKRRYPVVYALHGYSIGAEQWSGEIHASQTIAGAFAKGAGEVIVVLPDSKTVHNGSMYSSSQTTGDFETFVSRDLVAYVDQHYRTLARRESRGLVGHSMGGYGASRIGMRHADVFGALYMMSPCCLSPRDPAQAPPGAAAALAEVKTLQDATKLPWGLRAQLATAAAWSPNPQKPPLYLDLPVENGVTRPDVVAKWAANAPLAFIDQYVGALKRYKGIAIDVGDRDGLKEDAAKLHAVMDRYGLANSFEIYPGDHTSDVPTRFQDHVLPFFSRNLAFEAR